MTYTCSENGKTYKRIRLLKSYHANAYGMVIEEACWNCWQNCPEVRG